ncbi:MAG: cysteine synthase A [Clostridiales bacterium]|nr:cysteine synthase A [Clostridiales bacterium]
MAKIAEDIRELIGNTPLIDLKRFCAGKNIGAKRILAKLEKQNPAGSVKDRAAYYILKDAILEGRISEGGTVIEPTSGNTGIGIASLCSLFGLKAVIVMPDNMSAERRKLIAAFGAELVLTPGASGMQGALDKADELSRSIPNSIIAGQFTNLSNPKAHYETTGPEIWRDADGDVDIFVSGVGTGGTLSGVGRFLKEQKSEIKIIAVEPVASPLISEGRSGPHALQGIGANFIPSILDKSLIDDIICVGNEEAIETMKELAVSEGLLCGISSGAALCAAVKLAQREENKGKSIVCLLPDTGERYLSSI